MNSTSSWMAAVAATACCISVAWAQEPKPNLGAAPLPTRPGERPQIHVQIDGAVSKPGRYAMESGDNVFGLLVRAGNLTAEADLSKQRLIIHRAGADIEIDIEIEIKAGLAGMDPTHVLLREGDVVTVPRRADSVYIGGAVARPGRYEIKGTPSMADVLALAGGGQPDAALSRIVVRRGVEDIKVNARALPGLPGLKEAAPILLRDGDFVYVPSNSSRVVVVGEVNAPGVQIIPDGGSLTVAQALALSGGARPGQGRVTIQIWRSGPNSKLEVIERYADSTGPEDPRLNQLLQENDIVAVSRAPRSAGRRLIPRREPEQAPPTARLWLLNR